VSAFLSRPINVPFDYFDGDPDQPDAVTLVSLVGLNLSQATALHAYRVQEGRFLESEDNNAAVITESLAEALDLQLGDSLTLPAATGETGLVIVGLLPATVGAGNEEVMVTLGQAQSMLDMPGLINAIEANFGIVSVAQRAQIESEILDVVGESFQIGALSTNSQFLQRLDERHGNEIPAYRAAWPDWWTDYYVSDAKATGVLRSRTTSPRRGRAMNEAARALPSG